MKKNKITTLRPDATLEEIDTEIDLQKQAKDDILRLQERDDHTDAVWTNSLIEDRRRVTRLIETLEKRKGALKRQGAATLEKRFVDAARETLDETVFRTLMDRAIKNGAKQ